ncbi:MAG: YqeG family HAD IIIA-type phosphatase [Cyanobacteria bacterium]|nr:YqeG family HAD IIIA-type phosphatase [Cyanobacteriota bacterium]MDW8200581.1 YqeG family HAD IIIA-type phosphatase [Cyanobacteriota bacterium SKYGB_h_bin112]
MTLRFPLPTQVVTLASLDLALLKQAGIRGIILDLDNTIVSEDDRYLSPHAETWIRDAMATGIRFFLLSNGKRKHRVQFWSERLGIAALSPAKKPLPAGFRKAILHLGLDKSAIAVIGDSRHTDMLGAWLVGCVGIRVASLPHPPRWWERLLGRWVQTPYPPDAELWPFTDHPYTGKDK